MSIWSVSPSEIISWFLHTIQITVPSLIKCSTIDFHCWMFFVFKICHGCKSHVFFIVKFTLLFLPTLQLAYTFQGFTPISIQFLETCLHLVVFIHNLLVLNHCPHHFGLSLITWQRAAKSRFHIIKLFLLFWISWYTKILPTLWCICPIEDALFRWKSCAFVFIDPIIMSVIISKRRLARILH